jgi:hypothetical protein
MQVLCIHLTVFELQAYYEPNASRSNLHVLVEALVARVTTDDGDDGLLHATGVEFKYDGKTHWAKAKKEVIICAGYDESRGRLVLGLCSCYVPLTAVSRRPTCSSYLESGTGRYWRRQGYK